MVCRVVCECVILFDVVTNHGVASNTSNLDVNMISDMCIYDPMGKMRLMGHMSHIEHTESCVHSRMTCAHEQ